MKIKTQKDALTWGLEHWNCLAETGDRSKTLGFPAAHSWSGGCACCEYQTTQEAKGKGATAAPAAWSSGRVVGA